MREQYVRKEMYNSITSNANSITRFRSITNNKSISLCNNTFFCVESTNFCKIQNSNFKTAAILNTFTLTLWFVLYLHEIILAVNSKCKLHISFRSAVGLINLFYHIQTRRRKAKQVSAQTCVVHFSFTLMRGSFHDVRHHLLVTPLSIINICLLNLNIL